MMGFANWKNLAAALLLAATGGCDSGPRYVPVSGIVTLDGKPYGEAVVVFMPRATEDNPEPGQGSSSYTDASGRFELQTMEGDKGAVVGKHTVQIMTKGNNVAIIDPEVGSPDDAGVATNIRRDPIPKEWSGTGKDFEVPAEGTDKANFDIVTK